MKKLASLSFNLLGGAAILSAGYLIGVASAPVYQTVQIEIPPRAAVFAIAILACIYVALRNTRAKYGK